MWSLILPTLLLARLAVAAFSAISPVGADYFDLGGSSWKAQNSNGSINIPATVPGHIQLDLFDAKIIPDPYYSDNFNLTKWISDDQWVYSRQLPALSPNGKAWDQYKKVYLVFEGLDTVAHVRINGQEVGFANNQFRQWIFDVTNSTKGGNMTLEIEFESAIKYALEVFESTGSPYTVFANAMGYWTYPEGREYIRKIQSDFGWDWGPHFAPQGIYRDAYLVGLDDGAYVTNTFIDIYKDGQRPNILPNQNADWVVNVSVDYLSAMVGIQPSMSIEVGGHSFSSGHLTATVAGRNVAELSFNISEGAVDRWWPHEFGEPTLYNVSITLDIGGSGASENAFNYSKRAGFRTIVLDMTPYTDRFGSNFHFEVNGRTFNTKGSNMVPVDAFEPRVDYSWYKRLMQSSIAANFNMIRLWASGNYYSDDLYDLADELGIFLWSEFQFSDNFYPVFPEYLDNVREEVRYQMRRLNRHPCLSVWTGGNELEGFNLGKLEWNATYGQSLFENFTTLTMETVWPEVWHNTRSLSWLQSSDSHGYSYYNPNVGAWINRYGNISSDYPSPYYGPGETYNLIIDQTFNHSLLLAARFMVEFGTWSYDSLESYQTILPDDQLVWDNPIIVSRCYDTPDPINQLGDAIKSFYVTPNRTDPVKQFDQWTWTTQIFHAEHMKNQIESYRRSISLPENNLGQLFWQLNAPWTTLSLNSIEYTGRWKVLQYVASQVFQTVAVSSWLEPGNSTFNLWVTSDAWEPLTGTVTATWMTWSGNLLNSTTYDFALEPLDSTQLDRRVGWASILPEGGNTADDVLILKVDAKSQSGVQYTNENFFVPKYISNSTLVDPGLTIKHIGNQTWEVSASKGVSAYVWLNTPIGVEGYFTQNAIFLAKGENRTISFTVLKDTTAGAWENGVTVRSLWDNYEIDTSK